MRRVFVGLAAAAAVVFASTRVTAQDSVDARIRDLEQQMRQSESSANARIQELETRTTQKGSSVWDNGSDGAALFLYGVLCALWAQNTGRSAWLWFFQGIMFSVITVLVLLSKNSQELRRRRAWAKEAGG
jgi:hypothetical protein